MPVEVHMDTPLAQAIASVIPSKIAELGWGNGGAENDAMAEYFVLMLVNGKTKEEMAAEIAGDLLGLGPDDQTAPAFAKWLYEQTERLSQELSASDAARASENKLPAASGQDDAMGHDGFQSAMLDTDMDPGSSGGADLQAPTGPKAMRNASMPRGGREKRLVGQINRALDRSQDPPSIHRIRGQSGNERISRTPPSGPRGMNRQPPRANNGRAASVAHGLANMGRPGPMPGMPPMMPGMNMNGMMNENYMMGPGPDGGLLALMEQQAQMLRQMQQQLMMQSGVAPGNGQGQGRSLFERASRPDQGAGGRLVPQRRHHSQDGDVARLGEGAKADHQRRQGGGGDADKDVDMGQDQHEAAQNAPEDIMCKFNLRCANRDCKFAHQSPAAAPGITVDMHDVCSFGVACKNFKCVGRHPSPATKMAHQSEQDCKFFPNCTNMHCPFRHPNMPLCRNGGECKVPNCKFTHIKTPCRFRPCKNQFCPFSHEEGQRGTFQDKVWTADSGAKEHVSERRFTKDDAAEELVLPDDVAAPEIVV